MAKFSDLDPEYRRHLVLLVKSLFTAAEGLADKTEVQTELMLHQLLRFTSAKVNAMNDHEVEDAVKDVEKLVKILD